MWYRLAKPFVDRGELAVVGIVQDQHPDRAALLMQWKSMDFPILVDSLNTTGMKVVPLHYLIDEHGVVRGTRVDIDALTTFLAAPPLGDRPRPEAAAPPPDRTRDPVAFGDACFHRAGAGDLDAAIDAYRDAVARDPTDGTAHFRLGVALRRRFESDGRRAGDFAAAAHAWAAARACDPRHYIRMRRLQQYGPRMTKPNDFFGWVADARAAIGAREERPVPLSAEPIGAELGLPARVFDVTETARPADFDRYALRPDAFEVEIAVIAPAFTAPGRALQVHVHVWSDPAKPLAAPPGACITLPTGWRADRTVRHATRSGIGGGWVAEFAVAIDTAAAPGPHDLGVAVFVRSGDPAAPVRVERTVAIDVRRAPERR